jgi:hypothetical protein
VAVITEPAVERQQHDGRDREQCETDERNALRVDLDRRHLGWRGGWVVGHW